jgi:hypothetical protein
MGRRLFRFVPLLILQILLLHEASAQCNCGACSAGSGLLEQTNFLSSNSGKGSVLVHTEYWQFRNVDEHDHSSHSHTHSAEDSSSAEHAHPTQLVAPAISFAYNIHSRFFVIASLPAVFAHGGQQSQNGLSDVPLLLGYQLRLFSNCAVQPMIGVEFPLGKHTDNGVQMVQMGSGSYDWLAGLNLQYKKERWLVAGLSFFKKTNDDHQGDNLGSLASHSIQVNYSLPLSSSGSEQGTSSSSPTMLQLGVGAQNEWFGFQKQQDVINGDSGGSIVWSFASARLIHGKWSFPLNFSLPVHQKWNGEASLPAFKARLGLLYCF